MSESRVITAENNQGRSILEEFREEFPGVWESVPYKGLFVACLVVWTLLFEFVGNSTFGYLKSHSLIQWGYWAYLVNPDDEHGMIIPFVVLGLFWWKRKAFEGIRAQPWYPGLGIVFAALLLHIGGYLVQQTRISLLAFYFGLYGLIGLTWGPVALKRSFFPMCLFAFALPLGTLAESITFPMRLFATKVTSFVATSVLGISVQTQGTQIFEPSGKYQYEVAAACGGLRSLTAVLALCTIYGFMNFSKYRNRFIMIAAAFPLAITGNITRLLGIIIISDAFGREYGAKAHDSTIFSLLPYIPPILGIMAIGHFLRETPKETKGPDEPMLPAKESEPAYQA